MGTSAVETKEIVLVRPGEILGPDSEYEKKRLAIKTEYSQVVLEAKSITTVGSLEELERANNFGRLLQVGSKEIEAFFKPVKQALDSLKKPVLEHERQMASELDTEKRRLGSLITVYSAEQERLRQEAERAAREEAEKAAREEQLARAIELESAGEAEAAEAVLDEPVYSPVVTRSTAPVRMAGQVGKTAYSATVTDFKQLVKAVMEGKAPWACIVADESYLNSKARLDKEGFSVPGVQLNKESGTHFRA